VGEANQMQSAGSARIESKEVKASKINSIQGRRIARVVLAGISSILNDLQAPQRKPHISSASMSGNHHLRIYYSMTAHPLLNECASVTQRVRIRYSTSAQSLNSTAAAASFGTTYAALNFALYSFFLN